MYVFKRFGSSYTYRPILKCKQCGKIALVPYDWRDSGSWLLCCEICGRHYFYSVLTGLILIKNAQEQINTK